MGIAKWLESWTNEKRGWVDRETSRWTQEQTQKMKLYPSSEMPKKNINKYLHHKFLIKTCIYHQANGDEKQNQIQHKPIPSIPLPWTNLNTSTERDRNS